MFPAPFDTASIADLFVDLIVVGEEKPEFGQVERLADSYELEAGGSAAIFSAQFARLGGRPALAGVVGCDLLGRFALGRLATLGVDVTQVVAMPGERTPLGLNLAVGNDRAMLTVLGALAKLTPATLPPLPRSRHWHIGGFFLLEGLLDSWTERIRRFKAEGATISLDPNWAPRENWRLLEPLLPLVDVFLPNEREAAALTGCANAADAGAALARLCPLVVIKRGAEGAAAFRDGENWQAAAPVRTSEPVVDTTGAGDNFDAGFIWQWLRKAPIDSCLRLGVECGTASIRRPGGIAGQLSAATIAS